ncbi:MAG: ABC transporter permease [Oryzihumus sp.]
MAKPKIAGRTTWQIARARLRRDKVSMIALFVCGTFATVGVLSPVLTGLGWIDPYSYHHNLVQGIGSLPDGTMGGIAFGHWLGVEPGTGRDLLSRLLAGVTTSLLVAVSATLVSIVVGSLLGLVSGFAGGWADWLVSRFMDLVLSFPQTLMLLSLSAVVVGAMHDVLGFGVGTPSIIAYEVLVLGFFGWPFFARIIRGQVLSLREREFVEAARSLGAKRGRLYFKELLPHLWAPILVYTTLILPQNIAAEASLGFLGVGIQAPPPSLGSILNDSVVYANPDPAYFIFPGLMLSVLVLAFNLLGDGLRDALDPKSGRS